MPGTSACIQAATRVHTYISVAGSSASPSLSLWHGLQASQRPSEPHPLSPPPAAARGVSLEHSLAQRARKELELRRQQVVHLLPVALGDGRHTFGAQCPLLAVCSGDKGAVARGSSGCMTAAAWLDFATRHCQQHQLPGEA